MKEGLYIRIGHMERMERMERGEHGVRLLVAFLFLKLVGKRWVESCINKPKPGEKAKISNNRENTTRNTPASRLQFQLQRQR